MMKNPSLFPNTLIQLRSVHFVFRQLYANYKIQLLDWIWIKCVNCTSAYNATRTHIKYNWRNIHHMQFDKMSHPRASHIILFADFLPSIAQLYCMSSSYWHERRRKNDEKLSTQWNFVIVFTIVGLSFRYYFGWIISVDCIHNYCCHQLPWQFLQSQRLRHQHFVGYRLCLAWMFAFFKKIGDRNRLWRVRFYLHAPVSSGKK